MIKNEHSAEIVGNFQQWIKDHCGASGLELLFLCQIGVCDFYDFWDGTQTSNGIPFRVSEVEVKRSVINYLRKIHARMASEVDVP